MKFSRKTLSALVLPPGKPYEIHWDSELSGFGIRLNPSSTVWVIQYRVGGKTRRETIGRVEVISLDAAKDRAKATLARVQLGADPGAEKAKAKAQRVLTFRAVADRYLKNASERLKPRSLVEVSRHLAKDWKCFADLPISTINRGLISARLEDIAESKGPIAANRARATLSSLYSFAIGLGLCEQNAVIGTIKPGREVKRDYVLPDGDISRVWRACGSSEYGNIIKLLILTGQRRDEIGGMLWSEMDLDKATWTLPASRTKNRRSHEVPLSSQCLAILASVPRILGRDHLFGSGRHGFSGWSKAKATLDARIARLSASVHDWRVHDLRRTTATGMATLGSQPHVVEATLNHISGAKAGVAGIYNRATYRDEKRVALNLWADHIERLVT